MENVIREFLLDTANLFNPLDYPPEGPDHLKRWRRRWGNELTYKTVDCEKDIPEADLNDLAPILRTTLRRIWTAQDNKQREWYCFRLREVHLQLLHHLLRWSENTSWEGSHRVRRLTDYVTQQLPSTSLIDDAILWAQKNGSSMLLCGNPECPAPYLLRNGKAKTQRYCEDCANDSRRAAKAKWWKNNKGSQRFHANEGTESVTQETGTTKT